MNMKRKLIVIMPVYNEEGAIGPVLEKWVSALDALDLKDSFQIHVYNDGSKDRTAEILQSCEKKHPGRIIVHNKSNSGHGSTILQGYIENADLAEWLFQIDSDDEMGPEYFEQLWKQRADYDFLVGYRDGRVQALPRKIVSAISRMTIRIFYGKSIWDVNTPYRLMRSSAFASIYDIIPDNTFAPNIIISGMVARKHLRFLEIPVPQHDRTTGEVSIKKWKLLKAAMKKLCVSDGTTPLTAIKISLEDARVWHMIISKSWLLTPDGLMNMWKAPGRSCCICWKLARSTC